MHRQKFDQILLHVGHDKTGSTALQSALDRNRLLLLQEGYLYPSGHWHAPLGSYFHDEPENYGENLISGRTCRADIRQMDDEWMEGLLRDFQDSRAGKVILSYEGFFTLPETVLARIREFLLSCAKTVTIVAYCRRPRDYAISAISQRVKTGSLPWDRYTGRLADLRAGKYGGDPNWRLGLPVVFYKYELAKLARVFGKENVLLRKFGRQELEGGDVVKDFLSAIGGSDDLICKLAHAADRENPSLSGEAVQVGARVIAKLGGAIRSGADFQERVTPLLEEIPGTRASLSEDEDWVIRAATQKESTYLGKEWGIGFADVGEPEPKPMLLTETEVETLALSVIKRAGFDPSGTP